MDEMFFVVEGAVPEFEAVSTRYRSLQFIGCSYSRDGLLAWARHTFGPHYGPINTTTEAADAAKRGGWRVLKAL